MADPYDSGMLDTGDGNFLYWETSGNPAGKPALVLHGGPGSGCTPWHRSLFDPDAYRVILFDQRNCGRSRPHAGEPAIDLAKNTTGNLVADIELLREHLGIEKWLVLGGSWGSTLALAYAETHPGRVTEVILFAVTTGRRSEFDWLFRGGLARFFPAEWQRLVDALPAGEREGDVPEAYYRRLLDPDPAVHGPASRAWCMWESATPHWPPVATLEPRFGDPVYALAFARIVTHYICHNAWLEDGVLLRNAGALGGIPGVLVHGRFDFQAPLINAVELSRAWPDAGLVVVEDAGHAAGHAGITRELTAATSRFAGIPRRAVRSGRPTAD
jgi:proline iminopeptidase